MRLAATLTFLLLSCSVTLCVEDGRLRSFDEGCTKLLWFVGFQTKSEKGGDVFYLADSNEYVEHLKVAIISAKAKAPSLVPVVVLTGDNRDNSNLTDWVEKHGGYVVQHKLSFYNELKALSSDPEWSFSQNLWGSWLRVDIRAIMSRVEKMFATLKEDGHHVPEYSKDYILWTDPDVIFAGDINSCTLPKPLILSIGPEAGMGEAINYGVIYFNVRAFSDLSLGMLKWAKQERFHFNHDQELMFQYIGSRVTNLPDVYNWKLYWGNATTARRPIYPGSDIVILHFHGAKLKMAICFFEKLKALADPFAAPLEEQWKIVKSCGLKTPTNGNEGNYGHLTTKPYVETLASILFQSFLLDQGAFYSDVHKTFSRYLSEAQEHVGVS